MALQDHLLAGRYDVVRELQSGFYGTTWLARDKNPPQCNVCVKTFFSENHSQRKELEVLKQLCEREFHHDNVCAVLDVSLERAPVMDLAGTVVGSLQYVVFEYCSGSDLFNFLCTGPFERYKKCVSFPEPLARHYFTQCVLGLMYLHERGVYHRDIKPENCVLDANWDLKLTDFGTNKIMTPTDDMRVLRTRTGGVGTEAYRAPEVNSGQAYNPAAADVWSLGVTLFFFVAVEIMVDRTKTLDQFTRQYLAPLGVYFPFPHHCSKLDSYLRRSEELAAAGVTGSLQAPALSNSKFWDEWEQLKETLSPNLIDLFNRIFLLTPPTRITLRDMVRHPWFSKGVRMTPEDVSVAMAARCPSAISVQQGASPKVPVTKLLGGVDQTVLREALSQPGKQLEEFPEDSELWVWSKALQHLESIQLMMVDLDIQELMTDINFTREILKTILEGPSVDEARCVPLRLIGADWTTQLLLVVGFLPQGYNLYLSDDYMDLHLLQYAVAMLEGAELAVTRSVIPSSSEDNGLGDEEDMVLDEPDHGMELYNGTVRLGTSAEEENGSGIAEEMEAIPAVVGRGSHSVAEDLMSPDTVDSSQGSLGWTQYTVSTQSSQEELPESLQLSHDWSTAFPDEHKLIDMGTTVNVQQAKQFQAAGEFCKMSGLLCCYGLYQVVCSDQLALYCRGSCTQFSIRVVHVPTEIPTQSHMYLSTWCISDSTSEWNDILDRLKRDMNHHHQ